MPKFTYVARKEDGFSVTDTLEATNAQEARAKIVAMGFETLELKESLDRKKELSWAISEEAGSASVSAAVGYSPLVDTFRLYAGWLLAWYFAIYALGGYQFTRRLPFVVPFVDDLFSSSVIAQCSFAVFLFLLLTSMHRMLGRGKLLAVFLALIGAGVFVVFAVNV